MSDDNETVTIPLARLRRLVEALSYASVEAFEEARSLLESPTEDDVGELEGILAVFLKELQSAQELRAAQEQQRLLIERQQLAIRDLTTPIIDLWDDILTLPIVGVVDTQRAAEMTERLLGRIEERGTRCVIIDVTGVNVIDTMTAAHLVRMVNASRLMGSYCVVTGMRPEVAQTLVQSGVDIAGVETLRSLKEGLRECFRYLKSEAGSVRVSGDNHARAEAEVQPAG
ncbi:STAS domain-containing protein [Chondromyces apiculatus]|uniref:RsbR, positive regulator of sigma-B n=1 Tax=Chondromyces apiculatus DSM 436 TaxID=1192034 RepID=A0A017SV58_9BACT|nr:STAS domain-containing protein [Chondromyces apiculatus]EYF00859.1 RsbR, positive regulator of sigma-B [Chondromyces apiculatus DSM 436]